MIQISRLLDLPSKPWKNKRGQTIELAIDPPTANFPDDDFNYRISCADVNDDGPFSIFEGYDRALLVWKGNGLILNGKKLLPLEVLNFSGREAQDCKLLSGPVRDLGIIYKSGKVECSMSIYKGPREEFALSLDTTSQISFVFCTDGNLQIGRENLSVEEFARIENENEVELQLAANTKFVLIQIKKLTPL